jgi:hypothetical protein
MRNERDVRAIRPRLAPIPRNALHDIGNTLPGTKLEPADGNIALDHAGKRGRAHGSVSSACARSARMSSMDSIPTDNRTASSLTPLAI